MPAAASARVRSSSISPEIEADVLGAAQTRTLATFDAIMGLQFQNLVLNNLSLVLRNLGIGAARLRSASPYFQNETRRQQACQIDLLIDTQYAVYVCEIKFQRKIDRSVIDDVAQKCIRLKIDRTRSLRRVLIYLGELAADIEQSGAFDALLPFEQLLQ